VDEAFKSPLPSKMASSQDHNWWYDDYNELTARSIASSTFTTSP